MSDFYAKREYIDGKEMWKVYEVGSTKVLAVGSTITQAVDNYLTYQMNEEARRKLGMDIEDLTF